MHNPNPPYSPTAGSHLSLLGFLFLSKEKAIKHFSDNPNI
nr:MAG TPA: hypothetical protein [Caudoviricetes sp.]